MLGLKNTPILLHWSRLVLINNARINLNFGVSCRFRLSFFLSGR